MALDLVARCGCEQIATVWRLLSRVATQPLGVPVSASAMSMGPLTEQPPSRDNAVGPEPLACGQGGVGMGLGLSLVGGLGGSGTRRRIIRR